MVDLLGLMLRLLLLQLVGWLALALMAVPAHASIPTVASYHVDVNGTSAGNASTKALACAAASGPTDVFLKTQGYKSGRTLFQAPDTCKIFATDNSGEAANGTWPITPGPSMCPANSTLSGSACVCTSPYVENTGKTACVAPPNDCADLAGKDAGSKNWEGRTSSFTFCDGYSSKGGGKCLVTAARDISWEDPPGSAHWISQGQGTYTGGVATSCNGTGGDATTPANSTQDPENPSPEKPKPGEAAPAPCPTGQAPGTVNGTRVCAPVGDDKPKEAEDKKVENKANGDKVETSEKTACKSGGAECKTDTTTCSTPSGSTTATCQTSSTTQSASSLCKSSPGNKACTGDGAPSSFSGDCIAGYKASGDDAVLNAMAQEQYKRNCELLTKTGTVQTALDAVSDPLGTTKASTPGDSTVTVGPANFDSSNSLGGGGCNLNKTITVAHMTATLPFNVICDPLAILGQLLVAVSLLLAARIVARG